MPHSDPMFLGFFADDVVEAYRLSRAEAFRMDHSEIESDHLLLGLVAQRNGIASEVLDSQGLFYNKLTELREEVRERRPRRVGGASLVLDDIKASLDVKQILEIAKLLARNEDLANSDIVRATTRHVLKALVMQGSDNSRIRLLLTDHLRPGQEILFAHGIDLIDLLQRIDEV